MAKRISISKIDQIRNVAKEFQCRCVEGQMLDAFSAAVIVELYGRLSDEKRVKFLELPVNRMALLAYRLCG